CFSFFFQAEDGIRGDLVTGVQTCALPISALQKQRSGLQGQVQALQSQKTSLEQQQADLRRQIDALEQQKTQLLTASQQNTSQYRSEERRVGKEWRYRWQT